MSSAFPEWQGEEIVEDVPEFIGGKTKAIPAELVRHRGRVPPKRNNRNSVSPKVIVDIQTFECEAIEDDMVTDGLCAPSPLTLELAAARQSPERLQNGNAALSSKPIHSVRASPDIKRERQTAAKPENREDNNDDIKPRPPPQNRPTGTGAPATNPRRVGAAAASATPALAVAANAAAPKSINGTPNRQSPVMNEAADVQRPSPLAPSLPVRVSPRAIANPNPSSAAAAATTATTTTNAKSASTSPAAAAPKTSFPAVKPSPPPSHAIALKRNSYMKSSPSMGSLEERSSTSPSEAAGQLAGMPFSAPAVRSLPAMRRDTSAPTSVQAAGLTAIRKSFSADTPAALAAKPAPPTASLQPSRRAVAAAGATSSTTAQRATAPPTNTDRTSSPQPAVRTQPGLRPTASTAGTATKGSAIGVSSAPSPTAPATRPQRPVDAAKRGPSPAVPRSVNTELPLSSSKRSSNKADHAAEDDVDLEAGEYTFGDFFPFEQATAPPVSEQEPRATRQSARNVTVNASVVSSAGYSVLRGVYDSYATMDFGSTLPSVANLNATQNSTTLGAGSRVSSARPPNMLTTPGASAMRARGSFARTGSLRRPSQANNSNSSTTSRPRAGTNTFDGAEGRSSQTSGLRAAAAAAAAAIPKASRGTPEGESGNGSPNEKHRKRVPHTKRELRRRSTDFEEVDM